MSKQVAVVRDGEDPGWKVMVNHIKRGATLKSKELANREAVKVAATERIPVVLLAQ